MRFRWPGACRFTCFALGAFGCAYEQLHAHEQVASDPPLLVRRWTAEEGLSSSTIRGLAHRADGSLWISTSTGLNIFDGTEFRKELLKLPSSWADDSIGYIATGPDGQSYAAYRRYGFLVAGHGKVSAFGKAQGMKSTIVNMILPAGPDEAWIGTDGGFLYHYAHGAIAEVGAGELSGDPVYGLARAPDGSLWVATGNGLFVSRNGHLVCFRPHTPLPTTGFFDLAITSDGSIFAATDLGVLQIDEDRWRIWNTRIGLPSNRVSILVAAPANRVWIGTVAGLAELNHGKLRAVSGATCSVIALQPGRDEELWAGCEDAKGLLHVRAPILSAVPGVPDAHITSVAQDASGNIWMSSNRGLFYLLDGHSRLFTRNDGLSSTNVYPVTVAPDSSIWMGSDNGFDQIRRGKIQAFRTLPTGPLDYILSVLQDHAGTVWVGAARGLLRRTAGQTSFQEVPKVRSAVWSLRESRSGSLWAATDSQGVFRLSGGQWKQFTVACGLATNITHDTLETSDGSVWVITKQGLSRIRRDRCATLRGVEALSGAINAIADDHQGHLWLKTQDGLIVMDIAQADRILDGSKEIPALRFFGQADGVGEELTRWPPVNSIILNSSGHLWFALRNGLGEINPAILRVPLPTLQPAVYSLQSDTGERSLSEPVVLQPGDRRIQFNFAAPSLSEGTALEYRYRLAGFDDNWRSADQKRSATYTALPAGKYEFQVSARRRFGAWSDSSVPITLRVLPYFYQTWWWYSLMMALVAAVLCMLYQLRLVGVRRHYRELMAERLDERSRLARELHDTLAQGMVGIHLQAEAAQVLMDRDPQTARTQMEKIGRIAREIAAETRKSITVLRSQETASPSLPEELQRIALRFMQSATIPLALQIDADLPAVTEEVLHEIVRIVEEALTNVRLHSGAAHAWLTAERKQRVLLITVADNGVGFAAKEAPIAESGHFGLTGMRERAKRIRADLTIQGANGNGTCVSLQIFLGVPWTDRIMQRYSALASWTRKTR